MDNRDKLREEIFDFAYTQEKFGTIIEHRILTEDTCGCYHTVWHRTQYDTFTQNGTYYSDHRRFDNTNNMIVEWDLENDSTYITSKIMYPSLRYNKHNLNIDKYTIFKYIVNKTKNIDYAWEYSQLPTLTYEQAIWLIELFTGEKENMLEIYKNILDKLNSKYTFENNKLSIIDYKRNEFINELDTITKIKINKLSQICTKYVYENTIYEI